MANKPETSYELTENGMYSDDLRRIDFEDVYGEPVYEDDDRVIFADPERQELNIIANLLGMVGSDVHSRMHELAREVHDGGGINDPWAAVDPVVIDAKSFQAEIEGVEQ